MKLENFPADLPRIPFKGERLIVGPIYEIGEITPAIGSQIRIYHNGRFTFNHLSRQHSYSSNDERQSLAYILGIVEEEKRHVFNYVGLNDEEIQELMKKLKGKSYNLAYSDGKKKDSQRVHTINLINIEDIDSYKTIRKEI